MCAGESILSDGQVVRDEEVSPTKNGGLRYGINPPGTSQYSGSRSPNLAQCDCSLILFCDDHMAQGSVGRMGQAGHSRYDPNGRLPEGQYWVNEYDPYDPFSLSESHAPIPEELDEMIREGEIYPLALHTGNYLPQRKNAKHSDQRNRTRPGDNRCALEPAPGRAR